MLISCFNSISRQSFRGHVFLICYWPLFMVSLKWSSSWKWSVSKKITSWNKMCFPLNIYNHASWIWSRGNIVIIVAPIERIFKQTMTITLSLPEMSLLPNVVYHVKTTSSLHDRLQVTSQPVERFAFPVHHVAFVSSLSVITQPVAAQLGQPFSQQPSVKAVDSDVSYTSKLYLSERTKL